MDAARALIAESGPATWRDIAARVPDINPAARSEMEMVRQTVDNLCRAGELVKAGTRTVNRGRKPHRLYLVGDPHGPKPERDKARSGAALAEMLAAWDRVL
jgi:hypothetical protein